MAEGLTVQSFFFSYTGRSLLLSILGFLILPFVWSLPESLITAELSTALPGNGGFVLWTHRAFGPFPGFLIGTWKFLSGAINSATYPALSADYVARNIPSISSGTPRAIAVSATTILLSFLNYTMPTVLQFFHSSCGASEASTNQFRDIARAIVQSSRNLSIFFMDRPFKFFMDRQGRETAGCTQIKNHHPTSLLYILIGTAVEWVQLLRRPGRVLVKSYRNCC